jgi:hypothetical protein
MSRVLITNGGPHSSETWAMATAEQIFDIGSSVAGDRLMQAQKFQLTIAEALVPHHEAVQVNEREKLADNVEHINTPHDIEDYLDSVMHDIVAAAQGTPWQDHFNRSDVQDAARQVIAGHLLTNLHIERMCYVDRNPDCEVSQAYKAKFYGPRG